MSAQGLVADFMCLGCSIAAGNYSMRFSASHQANTCSIQQLNRFVAQNALNHLEVNAVVPPKYAKHRRDFQNLPIPLLVVIHREGGLLTGAHHTCGVGVRHRRSISIADRTRKGWSCLLDIPNAPCVEYMPNLLLGWRPSLLGGGHR